MICQMMTAIQTPDLLFVYGTLRRGSDHANAARLASQSDWLGTATLAGALYRVSWHPALVLGGTDRVSGDLVRLHNPSASMPWLDAFEGCGQSNPPPHDYRREICAVTTSDGSANAMVYIWNLPLTGLAPITSGDWLQQAKCEGPA